MNFKFKNVNLIFGEDYVDAKTRAIDSEFDIDIYIYISKLPKSLNAVREEERFRVLEIDTIIRKGYLEF